MGKEKGKKEKGKKGEKWYEERVEDEEPHGRADVGLGAGLISNPICRLPYRPSPAGGGLTDEHTDTFPLIPTLQQTGSQTVVVFINR